MKQIVGPLGSLETKFRRFDGELALKEGAEITGYASLFGATDQGGDVVQRGAYGGSLAKLASAGRGVKMLWQHDPAQPIGVWDEVREDGRGLFVKGRLLLEVRAAREAHVLLQAGAIDGLSIGYRTLRAEKAAGQRLLHEIELWEVSLVTFPMLPEARVQATVPDETDPSLRDEADQSLRDETDLARTLAATFREARELLA
jgi:HK97 family phage prohead protease